MWDQSYQPDRGDFAFLNFTLPAGTEQARRRPALVLSPRNFNVVTGLAFVCPITNQVKGGSFEVELPIDTNLIGVVLSDQLRSLEWLERRAEYHSKAPREVMEEVLAKLAAILGTGLD